MSNNKNYDLVTHIVVLLTESSMSLNQISQINGLLIGHRDKATEDRVPVADSPTQAFQLAEEKAGGERHVLIDPYLPRGFQLGHE